MEQKFVLSSKKQGAMQTQNLKGVMLETLCYIFSGIIMLLS